MFQLPLWHLSFRLSPSRRLFLDFEGYKTELRADHRLDQMLLSRIQIEMVFPVSLILGFALGDSTGSRSEGCGYHMK